ncbi:hypothetical protein IZ6_26440 [Terrihabitans soli]|uniref:Uncharacterized protein n=1 Tax=Terrihabitans soli TaxID=708113 RepID=A0A6S6QS60_9HYPH|nr:hypothetical protein [Terrihabitans soli]BCJ91909.1 hypothetical protein IZ6_26440 [Terrihabitans soli]
MLALARFLADLAPHRRWEGAFRILVAASALAVVILSPDDLTTMLAGPGEDIFETLSVGLVLIGIALRVSAFGFQSVPDTALKTHGAYSVLRHPVLVSDALMGAGLIIGTQVLWFIALGAPLVLALLATAAAIRDEETARALGAIAADWRKQIPALIPDLSQWNTGGFEFSGRAALLRTMPALFAGVAGLTALEITHDVTVGAASWNFWPADWDYYLAALAASFMVIAADILVARAGRLPDSA